MNDQAVKEIIISMKDEYQKSNRRGKTNILNSLVKITKRDRKHLINCLNMTNNQLIKKKNSGCPERYSKTELLPHIRFLWLQMERVSSHRMKTAMKDWLPHYKSCEGYLRMQLQIMSASQTLGRYVSEIKETIEAKKGISTTCPARYMKNKVPINTLDAKADRPGYTQTDTVAHCGNSAAGPFISSLTVTDLFSTWTENRAILTKK